MDAASGGFIAPFLYPELEWDFRLPLVKSINVRGHKCRLVYVGIDCYGQLKPNIQEAGQLSALLPKEQIDLNACTLGSNQQCAKK